MKNFHIDPSSKQKAIDLLKDEVSKRRSTTSIPKSASTNVKAGTDQVHSGLSVSKGLSSSCFDVPQDDIKSSTSFDELNEYMALKFQLDENENVLNFWLKQKSKFPTLFLIVQDLYAVPASKTTVERLFSCSKNTIVDKRTRLAADKVNKLLFLQNYLILFKSLDSKRNNENIPIATKRKTNESSSSPCSDQNEQQPIINTTLKKVKMDLHQSDHIDLCDSDRDEDEENDDVDLF